MYEAGTHTRENYKMSEHPQETANFIRQMDNIMSVELFPDGDGEPLVFWTSFGKRYLITVQLTDISADPFYRKQGLKERLIARRAKKRGVLPDSE
jgi:hypothetical protein